MRSLRRFAPLDDMVSLFRFPDLRFLILESYPPPEIRTMTGFQAFFVLVH